MYTFKILIKENDLVFPETNAEMVINCIVNADTIDDAVTIRDMALKDAEIVLHVSSEYDSPKELQQDLASDYEIFLTCKQCRNIIDVRDNGANINTFVDIVNIMGKVKVDGLPCDYDIKYTLDV